jgi:hypothetical protein
MQSESRQAHWQNVYAKKGENEVSWFQENPAPSLELIAQVGATSASAIIDIGGGASRLVDNLVERGFPASISPKLHLTPGRRATGKIYIQAAAAFQEEALSGRTLALLCQANDQRRHGHDRRHDEAPDAEAPKTPQPPSLCMSCAAR